MFFLIRFDFRNNCDLSGFRWVTNRPDECGRRAVAIECETGGSYALAQKWVHDFCIIRPENKSALEKYIGRYVCWSLEVIFVLFLTFCKDPPLERCLYREGKAYFDGYIMFFNADLDILQIPAYYSNYTCYYYDSFIGPQNINILTALVIVIWWDFITDIQYFLLFYM